MEIHNVSLGIKLVRSRLSHLKALIILDNVDKLEQLEKLALLPTHLGAGSRVVIISRDNHILRNHKVDAIYNVQLLNEDKAFQLLCRKAFKCDNIVKDYIDLAYEVLKYADGLLLAVEVLGSFLFDRDVCEWRSALTLNKSDRHLRIGLPM
ncbi:unnamed protein product [Sphenostylis stenocarpa]|uniref:NB-ARC domain-containing protein n=1 Tax=Sphenostylis stenocarpa TaxID=92480 RepID=A0AA87BAR9_9FABA|nr:unnamed protein product [Sphenostylis stenocarpa]